MILKKFEVLNELIVSGTSYFKYITCKSQKEYRVDIMYTLSPTYNCQYCVLGGIQQLVYLFSAEEIQYIFDNFHEWSGKKMVMFDIDDVHYYHLITKLGDKKVFLKQPFKSSNGNNRNIVFYKLIDF